MADPISVLSVLGLAALASHNNNKKHNTEDYEMED